ncbi:hypothetical protein C8J56DRAFT_1040247 [Mycena floridula]|nr:hypothetical protein C8J56DRAFT_1040247 [Mycena floridula]
MLEGPAGLVSDLDASKLKIQLAATLKEIPKELIFGQVKTDHMLIIDFSPETGWSAPEIKPYGPLELDPSSSCLLCCSFCPKIQPI